MHGQTIHIQYHNNNTNPKQEHYGHTNPEEFRAIFKQTPKIIKDALQQAKILFPTPPHASHMNHPQQSQQTLSNITHNPTSSTQFTLRQVIHTIIKENTTTKQDKRGAQAIKRTYLCQWQTTHGKTQQCRTEENLLHPDNILLDHNLLLIIQYYKTIMTQIATQIYVDYSNYSYS